MKVQAPRHANITSDDSQPGGISDEGLDVVIDALVVERPVQGLDACRCLRSPLAPPAYVPVRYARESRP